MAKITSYIHSLGPTVALSLKDLRLKAIVLLPLSAFCRPSDLACVPKPSPDGGPEEVTSSRLRLSSINWTSEGMEILWYGSKADKSMSANPVIIESASDAELCPVASLKSNITVTERIRAEVPDKPVFLSLRPPYKGLSSASIAQVMTQALRDSGQVAEITARASGQQELGRPSNAPMSTQLRSSVGSPWRGLGFACSIGTCT